MLPRATPHMAKMLSPNNTPSLILHVPASNSLAGHGGEAERGPVVPLQENSVEGKAGPGWPPLETWEGDPSAWRGRGACEPEGETLALKRLFEADRIDAAPRASTPNEISKPHCPISSLTVTVQYTVLSPTAPPTLLKHSH
jgi:hypothetical protein